MFGYQRAGRQRRDWLLLGVVRELLDSLVVVVLVTRKTPSSITNRLVCRFDLATIEQGQTRTNLDAPESQKRSAGFPINLSWCSSTASC